MESPRKNDIQMDRLIYHCCFPLPCLIIMSVGMPDRMSECQNICPIDSHDILFICQVEFQNISEKLFIFIPRWGSIEAKQILQNSHLLNFHHIFLVLKSPMFVPEIILSPSNYHISIFLLPCSLFLLKSPYFSINHNVEIPLIISQ